MWWGVSTLTAVVLMFGYRTSTSGVVDPGSATVAASSSAGTDSSGDTAVSGSTTFSGDAADTRYGAVQVQITVTDGTITDVSVPQYPSHDRRDVEINQRALPILVQETLDGQTADIDMVTGATYTSEGYRQSLQSALDEAGL